MPLSDELDVLEELAVHAIAERVHPDITDLRAALRLIRALKRVRRITAVPAHDVRGYIQQVIDQEDA